MEDLLLNPDLHVISKLSSLFESTTKEERRQRILDSISQTEQRVETGKRNIFTTKDDIESARVKYENLSDLCATMEQLKCSLEEHIKTVRLNEGSFGGTTAVLEYDTAKTRTNALINFIKARAQLDSAKEALAERGDDKQREFEGLLDMQQSYETLRQYVPNHGDDKALEQLKDQFLGFQSANLVFAIKQADFENLSEIQKCFEKLGRQDEFLGTFRLATINCLKEYTLVTTNLPTLISELRKEIEFVFIHHRKVLRRFMTEATATDLLGASIKEGISFINFDSALSTIVPEAEDPVDLLSKLDKILKSEVTTEQQGLMEILKYVDNYILEKLAMSFRSALTTYSLAKVNSWEISGTSFSNSLENFRVAITQLFNLFEDLIVHTTEVFDKNAKDIVEQPIEKILENLMVKLRGWNYAVSSASSPRSVDDMIEVCHTSGLFISQMEQIKDSWQLEDTAQSISIPTKVVQKWNRGVVEALVTALRTKCTLATNEMAEKMQALKKTTSSQPTFRKLPSFSHAPNEYVTTVGQEMLQLFHRLEEIFLDAHIVNAFYFAHKKKYDQEALFKKLLADISDRIMSDFVNAVRPVENLDSEAAQQFNADTLFLKDAFDDLRTGNTTVLQELSDALRKRFHS